MSASTGRDDYDQLFRTTALAPGEPTFILRARDVLASGAVRSWAAFAYHAQVPLHVVELALKQADRMEAWPEHRLPDGPGLDENAQKNLVAQFDRRAWTVVQAGGDEAIAMADRVGRKAAATRYEPLLRRLAASVYWQRERMAAETLEILKEIEQLGLLDSPAG